MAKKVKEEPEKVAEVEEEKDCSKQEIQSVELTPEMFESIAGGSEMFSYGLAEKIFMNDIGNRIFYIDDEITSDIFRNITMFIVKINAVDIGLPPEKREPIKIVINSGGGSVLDGLGLIDCIKASVTPVTTVAMGYCFSMAFNIFVAGDKRVAMPNSSFLCHDGETGVYNSTTKTKDTMKFYEKVDERLDKMIAARSKMTVKYLDDVKRQENFWFADEGKELGFVDYIIGEDITFEEIFGDEDNCFDHDCECCEG